MKIFSFRRLSIPLAGALLIGLLTAGVAIAVFTATRSASVAIDADVVNAGNQPSVSVSGDTATITFAPITLGGGRAVEGYRLRRNGTDEFFCFASPCTDPGLAPGSYTYEVLGIYKSWTGAYGPSSAGGPVSTPGLSFTSSSASCGTGTVTLPAGTTSWTSKVSRAYVDSNDATSVNVAKTGAGTLTGSPLTIGLNTLESTESVTLSGLTNGDTAAVSATADNAGQVTCNITVAAPVDTTKPTVTINQASSQADPTSTSPINFTVVFSEPTTTFATGDVTITGTAGGSKVGTVTGSGTTYDVAVTGMTTSGTVIASIGAGVASDSAGNTNVASTSTDNTVTWNQPATLSITAFTHTEQNKNQGKATFSGTGSSGATLITVTVYSDNSCTGATAGTATITPAGAGAWGPTGLTGNLADNATYWAKAVQGASSSNCFSFTIPNYT